MSLIKIGPYRIGKTLGVGSFSKVKMALHEPTSRKVAIKILNRKKLTHMDMDEKVRREINILRLFMHSHIIRLYEVIDTPDDIFVVMEYVAGGELFDYIVSRGRLMENEARRFFQQIISGVEYCHSHMVVHRDLKPENLLLDDQNNVKIADFGLSNMMRDGYFLKTSCGSPNYASPEVISGNLYAGPEVDVWSCGVILFALLCGSLPFDDENIPNLFRKIKDGIFTLPSYLSSGARDLISQMLRVDPIKRISISEIRAHEWFRINLPRYLDSFINQEEQQQRNQIIDEDALDAVVQMGWLREEVLRALSMGPELLTNSKMEQVDEIRPMAVAYHLMLDLKRKNEHDNELVTNLPSPASILLDRVRKQSAGKVQSLDSSITTVDASIEDTVNKHNESFDLTTDNVDTTATTATTATANDSLVSTSVSVATVSPTVSHCGISTQDNDIIIPSSSSSFVTTSTEHINDTSGQNPSISTIRNTQSSMQHQQAQNASAQASSHHPHSLSSSANTLPDIAKLNLIVREPRVSSALTSTCSSTTRANRLWYLGMRSRKEPIEIMQEIYRVLRCFDLQWKCLTPFKLKVRYVHEKCGALVKVGLQLYKTRNNTYVVDVQKLSGDVFPFMDLCVLFSLQLQL